MKSNRFRYCVFIHFKCIFCSLLYLIRTKLNCVNTIHVPNGVQTKQVIQFLYLANKSTACTEQTWAGYLQICSNTNIFN